MAKRDECKALTTGQVCDLLGISEQRLQVVVRGMPRDEQPGVVGGKRVWDPVAVNALRERLAELAQRRGGAQ